MNALLLSVGLLLQAEIPAPPSDTTDPGYTGTASPQVAAPAQPNYMPEPQNAYSCAQTTGNGATGECSCHAGHACSPCYNSDQWCDTYCPSYITTRCGCIKPIGDMYQHTPYTASPKMYYYFRPYNHEHVRTQAGYAPALGVIGKLPYSNAMFQEVYQALEAGFEAAPAQ